MSEKKAGGPTKTILDKLSNRTLMSLVKERKYIETISNDITRELPEEYCKRVLSKEACLELIRKDIKEQGEYQFDHNLTMKELKIWNNALETPPNLTASSDINNPNSPLVMKKRLKEELQKSSLENFIRKVHPSRKLLKASLELLGIDTPSYDRDELIGLLKYQVSALGLEYILHQLPIKLLQQMATEADLSINTTSKNLMVRHLVDMRDYRANQNRVKKRSNETTKETKESKESKESKEPKETTKETKETTKETKVTKSQSPSSRMPTSAAIPKKTRKLKPEEIDLVFDSDDSQDWNPNLHKMEDISIPSQDDADKDATSEDEEEDVDDDDYREHKKKRRSHHRSHHRRHQQQQQANESEEESSDEKRTVAAPAAKGKNQPVAGGGKETKKENSSSKKKSNPESSGES